MYLGFNRTTAISLSRKSQEIERLLCVPSGQSQKKRASVKDALFRFVHLVFSFAVRQDAISITRKDVHFAERDLYDCSSI